MAGRFADGNQIAVGRGWKHGIKRLLPKATGDDDIQRIAADAAPHLPKCPTAYSPPPGPLA